MKSKKDYTNETDFANVIYNIRKEHKLTQKELADIIQISDRTISKWEKGESVPDLVNIKKICTALNMSPSSIIFAKVTLKDKIVKFNSMISKVLNYFVKNIFIFGVIMVFVILLIYFLNNYNSSTIYEFKYDSDDITFENGYFIKTKKVNILIINNISLDNVDSKNDDLKVELYVDIKGDKRTLYSANTLDDIHIKERYNYDGVLDKDTFDSMNKGLYLDIIITSKNGKEKLYTATLSISPLFTSSKIFYERFDNKDTYDEPYLSFLNSNKTTFKSNVSMRSDDSIDSKLKDLGFTYDSKNKYYFKLINKNESIFYYGTTNHVDYNITNGNKSYYLSYKISTNALNYLVTKNNKVDESESFKIRNNNFNDKINKNISDLINIEYLEKILYILQS